MFRKKAFYVICIFIIFFLVVILCLNYSKVEYRDDLATVTPWNQLPNNHKFNHIEFNNNTYSNGESILNNDILDKLLSENELKATEGNEEYKIDCKIYSLKKINENYIIAIQFGSESNYYLYINIDHKIDTLKDFVEAIDFIDNSNLNDLSYNYFDVKNSKVRSKKLSYQKISKIEKNDLFDYIFYKNLNLPITNSQQSIYNDYFKYEVIINFYLVNLNRNVTVTMTDSGYLIIGICGIQYSFYMGEKEVINFIDYFF